MRVWRSISTVSDYFRQSLSLLFGKRSRQWCANKWADLASLIATTNDWLLWAVLLCLGAGLTCREVKSRKQRSGLANAIPDLGDDSDIVQLLELSDKLNADVEGRLSAALDKVKVLVAVNGAVVTFLTVFKSDFGLDIPRFGVAMLGASVYLTLSYLRPGQWSTIKLDGELTRNGGDALRRVRIRDNFSMIMHNEAHVSFLVTVFGAALRAQVLAAAVIAGATLYKKFR